MCGRTGDDVKARLKLRCNILDQARSMSRDGEGSYWAPLTGDPDWQLNWINWVSNHDVATDIAAVLRDGCVSGLTHDGERHVDEAWADLCGFLGVDPSRQFESLEAMISASGGDAVDCAKSEPTTGIDPTLKARCDVLDQVRSMARDGEHSYWASLTGDPHWQETWSDWIFRWDLGTDIAAVVHLGCVESLSDAGERNIGETWVALCGTLGLDPDQSYENLETMIRESKNAFCPQCRRPRPDTAARFCASCGSGYAQSTFML